MEIDEKKIKEIINNAIPLTEDCEIKRKNEFLRRAKLRSEIIDLLIIERDRNKPFKPDLEYKATNGNNFTITN